MLAELLRKPRFVYKLQATDEQTDRQTDRQTNRQTDRQTDKQTDRQIDRQTDTIRYDSVYLTCSKKLTGSQLRA